MPEQFGYDSLSNPYILAGLGILAANKPGGNAAQAIGTGGLAGIQQYLQLREAMDQRRRAQEEQQWRQDTADWRKRQQEATQAYRQQQMEFDREKHGTLSAYQKAQLEATRRAAASRGGGGGGGGFTKKQQLDMLKGLTIDAVDPLSTEEGAYAQALEKYQKGLIALSQGQPFDQVVQGLQTSGPQSFLPDDPATIPSYKLEQIKAIPEARDEFLRGYQGTAQEARAKALMGVEGEAPPAETPQTTEDVAPTVNIEEQIQGLTSEHQIPDITTPSGRRRRAATGVDPIERGIQAIKEGSARLERWNESESYVRELLKESAITLHSRESTPAQRAELAEKLQYAIDNIAMSPATKRAMQKRLIAIQGL